MTRKVKRPTRSSVKDSAAEDVNKAYKCADCRSSFSTESSLTIHCKIHNGKPYPCRDCKNYFTHNKILQKHMLSHDRKKVHNCPQCDKKFSQLQNLKMHLNIHTGAKPFKCEVADCAAAFAYVGSLKNHMASVHGPSDQKLSAKPDSEKLKSASVRNRSTKKHHRCRICKKTYLSELSLKFHLTHHVGTKPYKCPMDWCSAVFADVKTLQNHKRSAHTGKPCSAKPYTVKLSSGKRFMENKCLKKRKRKNGASYSCPECGKEFNQSPNLQIHMNRHLGLKPFKCKFEWCSAAFADAGTLRRHRLTVHSGNILFKCKLCDAGFKREISLQEHVKEFHKTGKRKSTGKHKAVPLLKNGQPRKMPVKCGQCNAEFYHRGFMLKHVRLTHSSEVKKTEVPKTARKQNGALEKILPDVSSRKVAFNCDQCNAEFKLRRFLELHIRRIHPINAPSKTSSPAPKRIRGSDVSDKNSPLPTPKRVPSSDKSDKIVCTRKRITASDKSDKTPSQPSPKRTPESDKIDENPPQPTSERIPASDKSDETSPQPTPKGIPAIDKADKTFSQGLIPNCDTNSVKRKRGRKPYFRCANCECKFKHEHLYKKHATSCVASGLKAEAAINKVAKTDAIRKHKPSFKCKYCSAEYKSKATLLKHENQSHDPRDSLSCKSEVTSVPEMQTADCQNQSKSPPISKKKTLLKCKICSAEFKHQINLLSHVRCSHASVKYHKLNLPKYVRKERLISLQKAVSGILSDKNVAFKCEQCSSEFKYHVDLLKHVRSIHSSDMVVRLPNKTDMVKSVLQRRLVKEISYKCELCNDEFRRRRKLIKHIRIAHGNRKQFRCPNCDAAFKRKSHLQKHVCGGDSGETFVYKCEHCTSEFKECNELVEHVRRHSSDILDMCDETNEALQEELVQNPSGAEGISPDFECDLTNDTDSQHECGKCGDVFTDRKSLHHHLLVHAAERG